MVKSPRDAALASPVGRPLVFVLILRVPYLLGQVNQYLLQNRDLVLTYSSGEYIREFDHLRVGLLDQFAQELKLIEADILLDDQANLAVDQAAPPLEQNVTVREHLKKEQNRLRQHLDNFVRLQNFEERDLQAALGALDHARQDLEKVLTELLLWLAVFLLLIMLAGKVVLMDLKALLPMASAGGSADTTGADTTFTSLHEMSLAALAAAGAENILDDAANTGSPLNAPPLMPPPAGLVALAGGGTAQVEILHTHETYKFFTVNFS